MQKIVERQSGKSGVKQLVLGKKVGIKKESWYYKKKGWY